jgi:MerR family mercuric resistance operon transcriptional regulator
VEARKLAAFHLDAVQARISDLRAMEKVLSETVLRCDAGEAELCPLIEVLGGSSP